MANTQFILSTIIQLPGGDYFVIGLNAEGKQVHSKRFHYYARMRECFAANGYALPLKKELTWRKGVAGAREATING